LAKVIGYARVSTLQQSTDRQQVDILAAGARRDDLYIDRGVTGTRASRPDFDRALAASEDGDTLVSTTLDRLGRSTQNVLAFAEEVRGRGGGLRVLNLSSVDTATPTLLRLPRANGDTRSRELPECPADCIHFCQSHNHLPVDHCLVTGRPLHHRHNPRPPQNP